jgi:hypothetical protein
MCSSEEYDEMQSDGGDPGGQVSNYNDDFYADRAPAYDRSDEESRDTGGNHASYQSRQRTVPGWFTEVRSSGSESGSAGHDSPPLSDHGTEENAGEEEIPGDDVTEEDLIRILEERFGDQWRQELHELRVFSLALLHCQA